MTVAGEVTVERWLYKDRRDGEARSVSPLEARLGIVGGFWTPEAAKRGAWVVAQMTPKKAEELLSRVGTMQPSKSSLDRLPKGLSARWEANREEFELALQNAVVIPENAKSVAVSLDGEFAPMEGTDPVGKRNDAAEEGRTLQGPAGYREAGVATLSFCDERVDAISAIRFARAPEPKKLTLSGAPSLDCGCVQTIARNFLAFGGLPRRTSSPALAPSSRKAARVATSKSTTRPRSSDRA